MAHQQIPERVGIGGTFRLLGDEFEFTKYLGCVSDLEAAKNVHRYLLVWQQKSIIILPINGVVLGTPAIEIARD